jgi:ectoine hydroxylase-related dioxygenase (phytanoyl-CoA dioxygenase family)
VPGVLSDDAVQTFWQDGFGWVDRLVDDDELDVLRHAYDEIIAGEVASPTDRRLGGITRQVMVPSMVHPVFEENGALAQAREIMRDLYGCSHANRTYDMLIDKPAGHPHETPWHQDAGYFSKPVAPTGFQLPLTSIQFWVALDDADADNGCMQFSPGLHEIPMAEHVVISGHPDDEGRLIGYADVADAHPERAVVAAIPAGGATFHTAMTPHYTGPNRTTRPRRAYIFNLLAGDEPDTRIQDAVRRTYLTEIVRSVDAGLQTRPSAAAR